MNIKKAALFFGVIGVVFGLGFFALEKTKSHLATLSFESSVAHVEKSHISELTALPQGELLVVAPFTDQSEVTGIRLRKRNSDRVMAFAPGSSATLDQGEYLLSADVQMGKNLVFSGDCSNDGVVHVDRNKTTVCMVHSSEQLPEGTLLVNTIVVNDDHGEALSGEFLVFANELELLSAFPERVIAGRYTITHDGPSDYTTTMYGDCDASGILTVPPGGRAECTVVHDDMTPTEGTIAITTDTQDGALISEAFTMYIDGEPVEGTTATLVPVGARVVEVRDSRGNKLDLGGDCGPYGEVIVPSGGDVECSVRSMTFTDSHTEYVPTI